MKTKVKLSKLNNDKTDVVKVWCILQMAKQNVLAF